MLDDVFLPWDHGSWKPNSPGVNWMWQFSNSFQKWAVVTLTQVTSVLVSCWSSVYRKFFEVLFIVNQRGNHIVKNWLPWSGNSLFTSTSFSPLKNPKAFIFTRNMCVLDSCNCTWTNSWYRQGTFWCILVHAHEELISCISQLWARGSACFADLPCQSLKRLEKKTLCFLPFVTTVLFTPLALWLPEGCKMWSRHWCSPFKAFFCKALLVLWSLEINFSTASFSRGGWNC